MKAISTVLSLMWHLLLGIGRLLNALVLGIIAIVGILLITIKVILRRLGRLFANGYQETWNAIYARIGSPVCEICSHKKTKGRLVKYSDCCDRWVHVDCHVGEKVAKMIVKGDNIKAAAYMTLNSEGKVPLAYSALIKTLRTLVRDPYKPGLFSRVSRVKAVSSEMDLRQAILFTLIG